MKTTLGRCAGLLGPLLVLLPAAAFAADAPVKAPITKVPPSGPIVMKPPPPQVISRMVPVVPPVITTLRAQVSPNSPSAIVRAGDIIVARGTDLVGIDPTITVSFAKNTGTAAQPNWVPNPAALQTFSATATNVTANEFHFAVPNVPPTMSLIATMVVTVTKGKTSATSKEIIQVGQKPTERKILSVEQTAVRAGGRVKIHGLGFDDVPGNGGYSGVVHGYFGVGAPGTVSNPAISVANRGPTYVELWLPQSCNQYGTLMLGAPSTGGGSETYIVATPPITVGCASSDPSGTIVQTIGAANDTITVAPGASVTIKGTGLRYVTKVVDQTGLSYPFTFATIGSGPSAFDQLTVSLAPVGSGRNVVFRLLSSLTDPVGSGPVTGTVLVR